MKRFMLAVFAAFCISGCRSVPEKEVVVSPPSGRVLIVYYSESKSRNTAAVAGWIRDHVGGDVFEIVMQKPYPEGYLKLLKEAKKDMDAGENPPIVPFTGDISSYDVIFIGTPVWYGSCAPPVRTFLSGVDLSGKKVVPFCTHGGGGAGSCFADIAKLCPNSEVAEGFAGRGSNIVERSVGRGVREHSTGNEVAAWLDRLGL